MLSNCYTFMTLSTKRPSEEQRQTLEAKFAQDRRFEELRRNPENIVDSINEVEPNYYVLQFLLYSEIYLNIFKFYVLYLIILCRRAKSRFM